MECNMLLRCYHEVYNYCLTLLFIFNCIIVIMYNSLATISHSVYALTIPTRPSINVENPITYSIL